MTNSNRFVDCYIRADKYRYNYGVTFPVLGFVTVGEIVIERNMFNNCKIINNGNYRAALIGGSKTLSSYGINEEKTDDRLTGNIPIFIDQTYTTVGL